MLGLIWSKLFDYLTDVIPKVFILKTLIKRLCGERSGSVVECLTQDRRAAGASLTASLPFVLEQEH